MPDLKIICHAEGDRCHGCDHYHGRADVCAYAKSGIPAVDALLNYRQLDEDGMMVAVSRQAVHEVVDEHKRLRTVLGEIAYHSVCCDARHMADKALAEIPVCEHDWVDARNSVVQSGEYCPKCGAIRAGNTG